MSEPTAPTLEFDRLLRVVDASGDCWLWLLAKDRDGYGQVRSGRKLYMAHRWVWEMLVGAIPDGLVVDHLCRVPACVNPDHMDLVTAGENVLRGYGPPAKYARQVRCVRGHPLSGDNLYASRGRRYCRACKRQGRVRISV